MPQNKTKQDKTQSGNVFVIIFIAVVLFGALGYTFSKSANKGTGNLTKQQLKIQAQEIISYGQLMAQAVDRVRRNGCSENQINFAYPGSTGYINVNAPADGSCDVFGENGGKITWKDFPNNFNEFVSTTHCVSGFGAPCTFSNLSGSDIVYYIGLRTNTSFAQAENLCNEINKQLNNTAAGAVPPQDNYSFNYGQDKANGTFTANNSSFTLGGAGLSNQVAACGQDNVGLLNGHYIYHHVLLAR